jgi:hypothetical protein
MIPKIIFTYWEGEQLSELHYLTIYTLHKYNPDLDIIIYTDEKPKNILREWNSHEHSININKKIPLSNLIDINPDKIFLRIINFKKEYNFDNNISIVFKADFIRIAKLYEHGGIWFDMDILFIKSIPGLFFQEEVDSFIFIYEKTIPTGFLASIPKSKYLEILYNNSLEIIKNKKLNNYQKIGPIIWIEEYNKLSDRDKIRMKILNNKLVYPVLWNELDNLFLKPNITVPEDTFGIHWYNGALETKKFINKFNLSNINPDNSLIENLIFKMNEFIPQIKEVKIEFKNADNLEEIQDKYYNKIMNINNNITVTFIISEKLLKTRVFTFYKCWKNGYCLNDSNTKIPKNITKIILKKI